MRKAVCILWGCAALTFGCIDPLAAVRGPDRSGVKLLQSGMSLGHVEQLIGHIRLRKSKDSPARSRRVEHIFMMKNTFRSGSHTHFS